MAGPPGSTQSMAKKKKISWKTAKPSKEPARNSLIQIDWNSRDGGKRKTVLKKAAVCC